MQLESWALIAELVGAGAIIVSLLFVGLQIRDNSRSTQAATFQAMVGQEVEFLQLLGSDCELTRIYRDYVFDSRPLKESEREQARYLFLSAARIWESVYLQRLSGALSDAAWQTREPLLREVVKLPAFAQMDTSEGRRLYSGEFIDFVNLVRDEAGIVNQP
jgi:hypothetical protein